MKNFKITLLLLFACFGTLQAQDKRLAIKINPLSIFAATANVAGEFFINEKMSVQLGFYYGQFQTGFGAGAAESKIKYSWLGVTPEFRYYFGVGNIATPSGLYLGAFGRYRNVNQSYSASVFDPDTQTNVSGDVNIGIQAFGGGILVGFQVVTMGGFVFDSFIGPQFSAARLETTVECVNCDGDETFSESLGLNFSGPGLRFGIGLGFAF